MNIITNTVTETFERLAENPSSFTERDRLIVSFVVYDIPTPIQTDILEAYDYYQENPTLFDGSTGAKENWVSKYEPPSMRHDLDYQTYGGTYKGRLYADLKFLDYKKRYQTSAIWRNIQYYAVRWGGFYFQLTNWVKGNTKELPFEKEVLINNKRTTIQQIIEWVGILTIVPFVIFFLGAIAMDFKHKLTIGWKLSFKWVFNSVKNLWNKLF